MLERKQVSSTPRTRYLCWCLKSLQATWRAKAKSKFTTRQAVRDRCLSISVRALPNIWPMTTTSNTSLRNWRRTPTTWPGWIWLWEALIPLTLSLVTAILLRRIGRTLTKMIRWIPIILSMWMRSCPIRRIRRLGTRPIKREILVMLVLDLLPKEKPTMLSCFTICSISSRTALWQSFFPTAYCSVAVRKVKSERTWLRITISTPLSGCLQISSSGQEFPPSLWCCAKSVRIPMSLSSMHPRALSKRVKITSSVRLTLNA